ncbi:MAG: hypothetical protein AVDCRST_MAG68-3652, partial [uncultured Gemmatimonadetes bacterium]
AASRGWAARREALTSRPPLPNSWARRRIFGVGGQSWVSLWPRL